MSFNNNFEEKLVLERNIYTSEEIKDFWNNSGKKLLDFIKQILRSVEGLEYEDIKKTEEVLEIIRIISNLDDLISEHKPLKREASDRFGNVSFRSYFEAARLYIYKTCKFIKKDEIQEELNEYLLSSMGNAERIDYGTGNELNFIVWLYGLYKYEIFDKNLSPSYILIIFKKYLYLVRNLQITYWLEPAGSFGRWGLDDYQIFPFLLGSAQLVGHPNIKPKSSINSIIVLNYWKKYLYLDQIAWIMKNKKGPIKTHSPFILDICKNNSWRLASKELYIIYKKQVLSRKAVMSHFLTGKYILKYENYQNDDEKRLKEHNLMTDCCVNKIPSYFSKSEDSDKNYKTGKYRIPFD